MRQVNAILAKLYSDGIAKVSSVEELVDWLFQSEERLQAFADGDFDRIASQTGIPPLTVRRLAYDHQFRAYMYERLLHHKFNPAVLGAIYDRITNRLLKEDVPMGAVRSILEYINRQMGLEKPRKLSVKQQSEVVVRVEPVQPVQVLEVLGVPVEHDAVLPQKSLPGPEADSLGESLALDTSYERVADE